MKVIDELKQIVEEKMRQQNPQLQRKYIRITETVKSSFLNIVLKGTLTLKEASKKMGINYSSAKALWGEYRKINNINRFKKKQQTDVATKKVLKQEESKETINNVKQSFTVRCGYKLAKKKNNAIQIIASIGKLINKVKQNVQQKQAINKQ